MKKILIIILIGISLCFVSTLVCGKIKQHENMYYIFERARADYVMTNPTSYLYVDFDYDSNGRYAEFFPEGVNTKGKIFIEIIDNRNMLSPRSHRTIQKFVDYLQRQVRAIYSFISILTTDINTDIVAGFYNRHNQLMAYFHEGKYYIWNSWSGEYLFIREEVYQLLPGDIIDFG